MCVKNGENHGNIEITHLPVEPLDASDCTALLKRKDLKILLIYQAYELVMDVSENLAVDTEPA